MSFSKLGKENANSVGHLPTENELYRGTSKLRFEYFNVQIVL